MRTLVFVHGRAQQRKDAVALKSEWVSSLKKGLAKSDIDLPIADAAIRFPYFGDTLDDLCRNVPADEITPVIVRGNNGDANQRAFTQDVVNEIAKARGISDAEIRALLDDAVIRRGPLNWEWVQGILKAIDRHVPLGSGASIALFTNDVYQYLRNPGIRDTIEAGVRQAMTSDAVVVSHSLGTVVAYNLLRREGVQNNWNVPLHVTLGSPLAIRAIRDSLTPIKYPACVGKWFNAMDERDVVALYPLTKEYFPVTPEIENKTTVTNNTENRHGITGYLSDKDVAKRVYDALTS